MRAAASKRPIVMLPAFNDTMIVVRCTAAVDLLRSILFSPFYFSHLPGMIFLSPAPSLIIVVTQIRRHIAGSCRPHRATARALHFIARWFNSFFRCQLDVQLCLPTVGDQYKLETATSTLVVSSVNYETTGAVGCCSLAGRNSH